MITVSIGNNHGRKRARQATLLVCAVVLIFLPGDWLSLNRTTVDSRQLRMMKANRNITSYNQNHIMSTIKHFPIFTPGLLIFDGGKFVAFGIQHKTLSYLQAIKYNYRYATTIPLIVRALKDNYPKRFEPGQPVWEMIFTHADASHSPCINTKDCDTGSFAPISFFGTTPKDPSIFPTIKTFPFTEFVDCLYQYKVHGIETCVWPQKVNKNIPFEKLEEVLVWRGNDYPFMNYNEEFRFEGPEKISSYFDNNKWKNASKEAILRDIMSPSLYKEFSPRWRAALLTVQAENAHQPDEATRTWIDAKFVGGQNTEVRAKLAKRKLDVTGKRIDAFDMSRYKYQIDFGGGGGTTWEGTVAKLLMPGVLFHHETPNKDWFYDLMTPWKHYVPIKCDLADLESMSVLAKHVPERMKQIAREATKLGEYLLSKNYMDKVYQELFVDYIGELVTSYEPTGSWESTAERYQKLGFDLFSVGDCDENSCSMHGREEVSQDYRMYV